MKLTIKDMRVAILDAYPKASMGFRQKVTRMPTRQIVAIYRSIQKRDEKHKQAVENNKLYHQIDIFEYLAASTDEESHTEIEL